MMHLVLIAEGLRNLVQKFDVRSFGIELAMLQEDVLLKMLQVLASTLTHMMCSHYHEWQQ